MLRFVQWMDDDDENGKDEEEDELPPLDLSVSRCARRCCCSDSLGEKMTRH